MNEIEIIEPDVHDAVPQTVPAATRALLAMEAEMNDAEIFRAQLMERAARAIKVLYREVDDVRRHAERVTILAMHRIGAVLLTLPLAQGTRGMIQDRDAQGRIPPGGNAALLPGDVPTLSGTVGNKMRASRMKKLAVLSKELVVLAIEAIQARDDKPEATIHEVLRLIARNDNSEEREVIIPDGRFATIVIDPPWDMQKIEREVRPNQVGFDYPTMTEEELIDWSLARDKAADDCHLFMWTTQKWRRAAERIIEAWGFEVHEMFVWHKPGGFQPVNRPQYNCEFVVYASLGTPVFIDTTGFNCCFEAPRREHSRKPDEFYDLIKRVTPGPHIDMFARGPHDGFALHGNETERFAA